VLLTKLSGFGVRKVMPVLFGGLDSSQWQSKVAALSCFDKLTGNFPKQVAAMLPYVVPKVSEVMVDMKPEVKAAAQATMDIVCGVVGNIDLDPFIPTLIECITDVDGVPECVHKLAGTTFVQQVEAPALGIMEPLLLRGLNRQSKIAIKRKSSVVIDNMCKLVEDPTDAEPFIPKLLPLLKNAMDEVSDPECRGIAARAYKTLLNAAGGVEPVKGEKPVDSVAVLESQLLGQLKAAMAEAEGCSEADIEALFASGASVYAAYAANLCTNGILSKNFDIESWEKNVMPYVAPICSSDAAAKKAVSSLLEKAKAAHEAKKKVYVDDDEEGEDVCNCDFSLAYGAMILINNATMRLKRGKRYGLCGHNGCGKSTLMKAIANGQVEGFPSPEEVRTKYVEHDIQSDQSEMNTLEFVMDDKTLKSDGVAETEVRNTLLDLGFTEKMLKAPITALSGGWKMKLALGRAMLCKADIYLLDEPTNHLDVKNVAWLEHFLCSLDQVTSMIVSHDSGFLDHVCTHIIHFETRKLVTYKGNLTEFVKQCPAAKKYYELCDDELKFVFPAPGFLEGVKNKDKAIVKITNANFAYPGADANIINDATIQVSLSSRVACLGPNGAGKSTFIKLMTGDLEASDGLVWKHQNMRFASVAQHAFHHIEQHLKKTPNEYIQWRYSSGEDKENLTKITMQFSEAEEKQMKERIQFTNEDGIIEKLVLEKIIGRRQKKNTYEYEIQWEGKPMDHTAWLPRDKLEKCGFTKMLQRVDEKEAARQGLYARPLTQKNVEKHLEDFGLDAEFGTHNRIFGLSGGQKVKVVLAAAMWLQPHVLVMDEPTNYLDRDALGALAIAVGNFEGGVVIITHNDEFCKAVCTETWSVPGDGYVHVTGNKWQAGKTSTGGAKLEAFKQEEEVKDALGNTLKFKGPKKQLSRKEIKEKAKRRKAYLERGEDLSTDSDWELDIYIGDQKAGAPPAKEKKEKPVKEKKEKPAKK
jgi:elongation factor 3